MLPEAYLKNNITFKHKKKKQFGPQLSLKLSEMK